MDQVKVAVVGTGLIATHKHLPALQRLNAQARVVGVCDVNIEAAQKVSQQFKVAKAYGSLDELLAAEKPDLVDICTPPRTHAAVATQAMRGGAHVMIEKPMAIDVKECD